jgi:putative glycosyltransferase (TIGR04348 family)
MIALHARRSAGSVQAFRAAYPDRPLIVALSGTDIYGPAVRQPGPILDSIVSADRLVALQDLAARRLPAQHRWKIRVIHQSALTQKKSAHAKTARFTVAVIGHLRSVKDPFRAAKAARLLPQSSKVRIVHLGAAETVRWAARARAEMRHNPRYIWRGDRPRGEVQALLAGAHAVVLSSKSEGGANVISEAAAAGIPVLASRIDGSVGLLGGDYPGYFPVGDTRALTRLLHRIETDPGFLKQLRRAIAGRAYLFRPVREKAAWSALIAEIREPNPAAGRG